MSTFIHKVTVLLLSFAVSVSLGRRLMHNLHETQVPAWMTQKDPNTPWVQWKNEYNAQRGIGQRNTQHLLRPGTAPQLQRANTQQLQRAKTQPVNLTMGGMMKYPAREQGGVAPAGWFDKEAYRKLKKTTGLPKKNSQCNYAWTIEKQIGSESVNGKVYKVMQTDVRGNPLPNGVVAALKVSMPVPQSLNQLRMERVVMKQINKRRFDEKDPNCQGAVEMLDPWPCVIDQRGRPPRIRKDAIVLAFYDGGDLFDYYWKNARNPAMHNCKAAIGLKIGQGLKCLHDSGFIHADFKMDQVLLKWTSGKKGLSCPDEVVVTDFGMAASRDHGVPLLAADTWSCCGQYVASVIACNTWQCNPPDPLGLNKGYSQNGRTIASRNVDWCSYALMLNVMRVPWPYKKWGVTCGYMGQGRRQWITM